MWISKKLLGKQLVDIRNFPNLNKAVEYYQDKEVALIIPSEVEIQGHLVIPQNITTKVLEGGKIKRPTGTNYTLRIEGKFQAPAVQVFEGFSAGDVIFGRDAVEEIKPHWFGDPESEEAINAAIKSGEVAGINISSKSLPSICPKRLGRIQLDSDSSIELTYCDIKDNYLYAVAGLSPADIDAGKYTYLYIVDINNQENPQLAKAYDMGGVPYWIPHKTFDIKNNYLFVFLFDINAVKVFDISNPTNPIEISCINDVSSGTCNNGIFVTNEYCAFAYPDKKIYIIDFADFSNPQIINIFTHTDYIDNLYVDNNTLFIISSECGSQNFTFYIYDISDLTNPQQIGCCSWTKEGCYGSFDMLYDKENKLFFLPSNTAIAVVDVSSYTNPSIKCFIEHSNFENLQTVKKSNNYLYVIDQKSPSKMYILNITDLTNVEYSGELTLENDETKAQYIVLKNDYAYIVSNNFLVHLSIKKETKIIYYNADIVSEKEVPGFIAKDISTGGVTRKFASSGGAAKILSETNLEIMNLERHASRHAKDGVDPLVIIPKTLRLKHSGSPGTDNAFATLGEENVGEHERIIPITGTIEIGGTLGTGETIKVEIWMLYESNGSTEWRIPITKEFTATGVHDLTNSDIFSIAVTTGESIKSIKTKASSNLSSTDATVTVRMLAFYF